MYNVVMKQTEQIVFVDEQGQPTGQIGPKLESHTARTQRHLGFSCYIFRRVDNKLLVTQRALSKKVWPGVWTNSVCGHPAPDETFEAAIRRRAAYELGIHDIQNLRCVLPAYKYTTPPYKGIIENEFCPVYIAFTDDEPQLNPDEVEAYKWLAWSDYAHLLTTEPQAISYWAKDQFRHLEKLPPFNELS